jgi:hypothetical protein
MDNLQLSFQSSINETDAVAFLRKNRIKVTKRDKGKADRNFLFARQVGPHQSKWAFTVYPDSGKIVCSGGPSTTFFGFNNWVSLAEHLQMQAIVNILRDNLNEVDGFAIKKVTPVEVLRVEITHLYPFNSLEEIIEVERALYPNLVARYEGRVQLTGEKLMVPGTLRVGLTKSATLLRIYAEAIKFEDKPSHISTVHWEMLKERLENCVRVECIFNKAQLESQKLAFASAWKKRTDVLGLVDKRMKDAGLRGVNQQDPELLERKLAKAPDAVTDMIFCWKSGGTVKKSGTWSRAQELVKSCGYDLTIPYFAQEHIAHGYVDAFGAKQVYELPIAIRQDPELFHRWWDNF